MAWEVHAAALANAEGDATAMAGAVAGVCATAAVDPGAWVHVNVLYMYVWACAGGGGERATDAAYPHPTHNNPPPQHTKNTKHEKTGHRPSDHPARARDGGAGHAGALSQAVGAGGGGRLAAGGGGAGR